MIANNPLIVLTGPTAVGKTQLSISLAKAVGGEIISADSMQVYQDMDIGTAKIMPDQMDGIKHYLLDLLDPAEEFHVVKFKEYAKTAIGEIYEKGKIPILVGGTGFYIQAVLNDINFIENKTDWNYRTELEEIAKEKGDAFLHQMLCEIDPASAVIIHENNRKRIIRALEFYKLTGIQISKHNEEEQKKSSPYHFSYFVLTNDRSVLYHSIDRRVDQMILCGLVEEVRGLKEKGYARDLVSMQGLGYKEIYAHLDGEMSLEEAITLIKRNTRHFAKRQITWFKREKEVIWFDKSKMSEDMILSEIIYILKEKGILS